MLVAPQQQNGRSAWPPLLRMLWSLVAGREEERPWIADHVHTPAARDFPPGATRKRPLIYV